MEHAIGGSVPVLIHPRLDLELALAVCIASVPGHGSQSYPERVSRYRSPGSFVTRKYIDAMGLPRQEESRYGSTEGALRGCEQHPLSSHCITVKRGTSTCCAKAGFLVCIVYMFIYICSRERSKTHCRPRRFGNRLPWLTPIDSQPEPPSIPSRRSNYRNGIPGCLTAPISTISICRRCRGGRRCLDRKVGCAETIISK